MANKSIIQTINKKEMNRKEFLKYSGAVLLGLVGLKGLVTLLTTFDDQRSGVSPQENNGRGFGSGKYGK